MPLAAKHGISTSIASKAPAGQTLRRSGRLTIVSLGAAFIFLSGCASYQPDLTQAAPARIRMVAGPDSGAVAAVLKENCVSNASLNWDANAERMGIVGYSSFKGAPIREKIGLPIDQIPDNFSYIEREITGNRPIRIGYYSSLYVFGGRSICAAGMQFIPESGRDYEAVFQRKGRAGDCSLQLWELGVKKDGSITRERVPGASPMPHC